jgi:protein-tyrosine-phosphatase
MPRILFVCTGNICRSVMAEAFFRRYLGTGKALGWEVGSAGLEAEPGRPPELGVVRVMSEYGLDVSGHRARRLTREMVEEADLVLAMALHNSQRLVVRHQEAAGKVFTLKEFVIRGLPHGEHLDGHLPAERLRFLMERIRRIEGWEAPPGGEVNHQIRSFLLHYFHLYGQELSIDDPLGQSMDFMRRVAEEIREAVDELAGPRLLGIIGDLPARGGG